MVALLPPHPLQGGDAAVAADAPHGAQGAAHARVELLQGAQHIPVNVEILNTRATFTSLVKITSFGKVLCFFLIYLIPGHSEFGLHR